MPKIMLILIRRLAKRPQLTVNHQFKSCHVKHNIYLCATSTITLIMESKEYFEKIMQDYNQNGKGRSLRKYCKDEAVDYNWLIEFRKTFFVELDFGKYK